MKEKSRMKEKSPLIGKKRVWLDPAKERVISQSEFEASMRQRFQKGLEEGFQNGFYRGKEEAAKRAFSDLAEVWTEVAKHSATVNAYARSLADIHRSQAAEQQEEKK